MRLRVYVFGSLLLWVALFIRLSILQVVSGGEYKRIAEVQHKAEVEIAAERGKIFDRDLEPLAVSYECRSCYAHPHVVQDPEKAASRLSKIGLGSRSEILKKLRSKRGFVWLKRKVSPQITERVKSLKIDGVYLMSDLERAYPKGIAGNVIGFCGGETTGLEGIEYEFDGVLRGRPGKMVVQKDARGQLCPLPEYPKRDPQKGLDIVLNIDADLQSIAEKELERGVDRFNARAATCIITNPSTGEVLALANVPSYNPNRRGDGTPDEWRNRTITDLFEPGSTLKIIALAAALEERLLARDDTIEIDSGRIVVQTIPIEDVKKFTNLTAAEVLIHSSNVGAVKIGQALGRPKLYEYLRAFGFGNRMGIDLPGEVKGILAPPDEWSDIRLANIAIGQGISVTAVQLAFAFGTIANKGILMRPTIVKRIVDPAGNVIREFEPTEVRRVISQNTAEELVGILTEVVEYGTGVKAKYPGLSIAGKTGTAQKLDENGRYSHKQFTSSFCGFFPAEEAKILMSIVVDEPHGSYYYGGDVACSIFKEITVKMVNLRDYRYLAYENQDEEETVANRF